ncbi:MAG: hypothetical protein ACI81P_000923 [Neolewinella sp.]|jgi:hypothetical protein
MTNPSIKAALEVTELEERFELTTAGADADKFDDNHIVIDLR